MKSRSLWLVMCSLLLCESLYRPVQAYSVLGKNHKHGDLGQERQQAGQEDAGKFSGEAIDGLTDDSGYPAGVQMMGMTTSNSTEDTVERLVGDILVWNSMLASSNVRLGYCNSHAEEVLGSMDITGVVALVTRIAVYEDEGCEDAATRLAQSVVRALGVKSHQIQSLLHEECVGNKEDPMACENRVHDILDLLPDIIILYTTAAAAVYGSDHQTIGETRAKELAHFLDIPEDVFLEDNNSSAPRREKRDTESCVDKKEAKAQQVISWIPFIGTLYNLISSGVYAGKGCKSVAKERAIEGSIDLGADLITAVTLGAGSAAVIGGKTAVKVGVKMGVKAALKQGGRAALKTGKSALKKAFIQTGKSYANPFKAAAKEVVDLGKLVGKVPKTIKKIPKVVKKIPTAVKKIPGSVKKSWTSVKSTVDQIAEASSKKTNLGAVDNVRVKGDIPAVHKICKRASSSCRFGSRYDDLLNQKSAKNLDDVTIDFETTKVGQQKKIDKFAKDYGLTESESSEIYRYSYRGYTKLNKAMRGQEELTEELMKRAELIQNGLLKVQQRQNPGVRMLYRKEKMWEGFNNFYKKGETVTMPTFTSTSASRDFTIPKEKQIKQKIKYTINTNKGASIKEVSGFPSQDEVLLPAGSKFVVDDVTTDRSTTHVTLTDISL